MITLTPDNIAETLRTLRIQSGFTQTEIAGRLFVTPACLSYWERGENGHGPMTPRMDNALKWAGALGYDVTITLTPKECR
jgi:transcriptional regulator with XRE-family HTH domain